MDCAQTVSADSQGSRLGQPRIRGRRHVRLRGDRRTGAGRAYCGAMDHNGPVCPTTAREASITHPARRRAVENIAQCASRRLPDPSGPDALANGPDAIETIMTSGEPAGSRVRSNLSADVELTHRCLAPSQRFVLSQARSATLLARSSESRRRRRLAAVAHSPPPRPTM